MNWSLVLFILLICAILTSKAMPDHMMRQITSRTSHPGSSAMLSIASESSLTGQILLMGHEQLQRVLNAQPEIKLEIGKPFYRKIILDCSLDELSFLRVHVFIGFEHWTRVAIEDTNRGIRCSARSPRWVACRIGHAINTNQTLEAVAALPWVISVSGTGYDSASLNDKFAFNLLVHGRNDSTVRISGPVSPRIGNLNGSGVVIAVSDTGCDPTHCFFEGTPDATPQVLSIRDPSRRKILQYMNYADNFEKWGGHGTLTAGIAVGSAPPGAPAAEFSGIASASKLIVVDAFDAEDRLGISSFLPYYEEAYAAGARVFSESWGDPKNKYSASSRQIDEFTRKRRDAVVVRSTGNYGRLNSECNSKNAIAVGATNQVYLGYGEYLRIGLAPWSDEVVCHEFPALCSRALSGEFNRSNVCNSVLSGEQCWANGTAVGYDLSAPNLVNEWTVAGFSTRGPTRDGRVRPHFVAPGVALAGSLARPNRSRYSCDVSQYDLWQLSGTSFSTPAVAGLASLVVQYWHNQGLVSVPASLVRATLVTASSFPEGMYGEAPSSAYGYGVPTLNVLDPQRLTVVAAENITIRSFESRTLCFHILANCTADVVLTWTDSPALVDSASPLENSIRLNFTGVSVLRIVPDFLPADNTARWQLRLLAGHLMTITISASALGGDEQDFSLLLRGLDGSVSVVADNKCNQWECVGDEVVSCSIPDGTGQQLCRGTRMSPCRVKSCQTGSFPSKDGTTCSTPILLWQLNLALSGAVMLLIVASFLLLACLRLVSCWQPPSDRTKSRIFKIGMRWWGVLLGFEGIWFLAAGSAFLFVSTASDLLQPVFVGIVVQQALATDEWGKISIRYLLLVIGLSVAVWIASSAASVMISVAFPFVFLRRSYILLFQKLSQMRMRWHEKEYREFGMGPVRWAIFLRSLPQIFSRSFMTGLTLLQSAAMSLCVSLVMLAVISWQMLLLLVGIGLLSLALNIPMGRVQVFLESRSFRASQEMSDLATDCFDFFEQWYILSCWQKLRNSCYNGVREVFRFDRRKAFANGMVISLVQNFQAVALPTIVFWFGIYLMSRGTLSAGIFLSVILYASRVSGAISQLTGLYGLISTTWSYLPKMATILLASDIAFDGNEFINEAPRAVQFENVTFQRPGKMILAETSLCLLPGMNLVLGASGCGKSTLISLVTRTQIAESGTVFVGSSCVMRLRRVDLSRHVTWLRQHPKFPAKSSFVGLCRLFAPNCSEATIKHCAEASGALVWMVKTMAEGPLFSVIPASISGGQRKSLELAFGHLKDGSVVLADEITSDFDPASAKAALATLAAWATAGKVVVHVTHDMEIITGCPTNSRLIVASAPGKFKEVPKTDL